MYSTTSPKESMESQRNSTQSVKSANGPRASWLRRLSHRNKSNTSITSLPPSRPTSSPRSAPPDSQHMSNAYEDTTEVTSNDSLSPQPQRRNGMSRESPDSGQRSNSVASNTLLRPGLKTSVSKTTVSDGSENELTKVPSRGGVRWANAFDTADGRETRPREASAVRRNASNRRSSIYSRHSAGGYFEGVDAGVGSKARKLSVDVPTELLVDECTLEEHFTVVNRMKKRKIGEGGAAAVQLMQSKTAGHPKERLFAVKEFRPWSAEDETELEYLRKIKSEYAIAKSCEHPNIVETFRLCHSGLDWFHVMEYCDQGDLCDLINKNFLTQNDKDCLFKQLLRGVDYLHAHGIAHRDLKSENLLLNKNGCLKIADFGTAEVFRGRHPGLRSVFPQKGADDEDVRLCAPGMVGSTPYMAPEVLDRSGPYDPRAVDVWSCAIVYLSMCFCGLPWDKASAADTKNFNIYLNTWDEFLEAHPDGKVSVETGLPKYCTAKPFKLLEGFHIKALIVSMLHPDPAKRMSAHEAVESGVVKNWTCCQANGREQDWKMRERIALHHHLPAKKSKVPRFLKPSFEVKVSS